ncbi:hypothetical protein [Bradyrhizobium sp.]|uniref:hypothetical protein n=1 Tax=Bradyrhizobium sp. TaxID=376 RepID=UPI001D312FF7|nr:hypothetical protein [Bradyrhizobium sp.]MBI5319014.1 hypothetical protein [Bradyrhizobium sp.]
MIQDVIRLVRGYTDALFAGFTKAAKNGRKVIYPWGLMGRGYVIATDEIEEQLKQRYAVSVVVVTILLGIAFSFGGFAGGLGVLILCLVGYVVYVKRLVAGMESSDEGLPLVEAYAATARAYSPRQLWSWVYCGLVLIGLGIAVILTGQSGSIKPELGILPELVVFFGFGILVTAFGGWMLFLRRGVDQSGAAAPPPASKSIMAEEIGFYFTGQMGPLRAGLIAFFGLALSGAGIFMLLIDSAERSMETVGMVVLFGLIAAWGIAELVLRYRERHR